MSGKDLKRHLVLDILRSRPAEIGRQRKGEES
jgi:hypothetical protein